MMPILYRADETEFDTYGIGMLSDCTFCEVTEERNGAFECVMKYPLHGALFDEIKNDRVILVKPNDTSRSQPFRIYRITTPMNGIITVYAQHMSYDLSGIGVLCFESKSVSPQLALERIFANTSSKHGFKCRTDLSAPRAFSVSKPMSIRACLGGTEGSVLDVWGGEYEWDMFDVILHSKRGKDNGVVIEYGKNLTSLEQDNDFSSVYTHLLPYAVIKNGDTESVVTLSEITIPIVETYAREKTLIKDFSSFFKDGETVTEDTLRAKAKSYIKQNLFGDETPTVKVSFEPLWQQPEYSQFLEKVNLCDTVIVRHPDMNIEVKTKVIETVYDALAEKYSSITLGTAKSNFVNTVAEIKSTTDEIKKETDSFPLLMNTAIKNATSLISGQQGGFVVMHTDSVTGKPYELLILDNENLYDTRNVWRWNVSGLGFSKSGYNGPYETAITADGKIVADFITSGTLMANIIKAGVISSADNSSWWDLESGEVHLSAYTKTEDTDKLSDSIAEITERTSTLEQTAEDISFKINEQSTGGKNYLLNSSALNGLSDDWEYSGLVTVLSDTDVISHTSSGSAFVLGAESTLSQSVYNSVADRSFVLSLRAKKSYSQLSAYMYVQYNGVKREYLFNTKESFDWTDFSVVLPDVSDGEITVFIYSRDTSLTVSDLMLTDGSIIQHWSPAPNEIYTNEVKIDRKGIEVSNSKSSQKTVITNTEFSGYYNGEKIFTLNKDETQTKKTTVDGELTIGRTKLIPMSNSSPGLNIVILD
ncbi:phage tail spike protein [uncultured Ruminococcus sp.]|uniref:phage tail spike protein n=1 Tax=uncultured Ruminococcus sp. TaxID=165186 RepID=UPI0026DAC3FB|nr:phage tail spike protein [uncultured Ruminococcus sp.]